MRPNRFSRLTFISKAQTRICEDLWKPWMYYKKDIVKYTNSLKVSFAWGRWNHSFLKICKCINKQFKKISYESNQNRNYLYIITEKCLLLFYWSVTNIAPNTSAHRFFEPSTGSTGTNHPTICILKWGVRNFSERAHWNWKQ